MMMMMMVVIIVKPILTPGDGETSFSLQPSQLLVVMMMMMMMKLPDDVFRHVLLPYLSLNDLGRLDDMCMNHEYRPQVLDKMRGVIIMGDGEDLCMNASLFRWLGLRGIYVCSMRFIEDSDDDDDVVDAIPIILLQNDYVDQFRYTQHLEMRGRSIRDASIISISTHCTGLQSLNVSRCTLLTDASIISISTHWTGLQSLNVSSCSQLTDASIISVSTHCTGLQSLDIS